MPVVPSSAGTTTSRSTERLALALCQLLGGWHLLHDAPALTRLGAGELTIDVLRGTCRHDRRWIAPLRVVGRLRARLREALAEGADAPKAIHQAVLDLRLDFSEQGAPRDRETVWCGAAGGFIGCRLAIRCQVTTEDGAFATSLDAWQEWPREWAER